MFLFPIRVRTVERQPGSADARRRSMWGVSRIASQSWRVRTKLSLENWERWRSYICPNPNPEMSHSCTRNNATQHNLVFVPSQVITPSYITLLLWHNIVDAPRRSMCVCVRSCMTFCFGWFVFSFAYMKHVVGSQGGLMVAPSKISSSALLSWLHLFHLFCN